jgi:heme-degrading monooxygenase HmoA
MLSNTYKIKPWQLLNMTILAILTGDGLTKEMYENVRKEVNWEGNPPSGVIFHAMSFDDSGKFCVAEVWESEEQWNNFFNGRLKSSMQKTNVSPPKAQILQIHKIDALPGLDRYKVH